MLSLTKQKEDTLLITEDDKPVSSLNSSNIFVKKFIFPSLPNTDLSKLPEGTSSKKLGYSVTFLLLFANKTKTFVWSLIRVSPLTPTCSIPRDEFKNC